MAEEDRPWWWRRDGGIFGEETATMAGAAPSVEREREREERISSIEIWGKSGFILFVHIWGKKVNQAT